MVPLRAPRRRGARHHVAIAHGHYDPVPDRRRRPRPAWLIGDAEIAATGADYVALGHWNQTIRVGAGPCRRLLFRLARGGAVGQRGHVGRRPAAHRAQMLAPFDAP